LRESSSEFIFEEIDRSSKAEADKTSGPNGRDVLRISKVVEVADAVFSENNDIWYGGSSLLGMEDELEDTRSSVRPDRGVVGEVDSIRTANDKEGFDKGFCLRAVEA